MFSKGHKINRRINIVFSVICISHAFTDLNLNRLSKFKPITNIGGVVLCHAWISFIIRWSRIFLCTCDGGKVRKSLVKHYHICGRSIHSVGHLLMLMTVGVDVTRWAFVNISVSQTEIRDFE